MTVQVLPLQHVLGVQQGLQVFVVIHLNQAVLPKRNTILDGLAHPLGREPRSMYKIGVIIMSVGKGLTAYNYMSICQTASSFHLWAIRFH